jgi:hypothetical protein
MENQQLSITDLAVLKNVIDVASTRGAFQASEMKTVGEIYEKLTAFLNAVVAQAEAQTEAQKTQQSQQQGDTQ